jgi:protochlorophyllide reductase
LVTASFFTAGALALRTPHHLDRRSALSLATSVAPLLLRGGPALAEQIDAEVIVPLAALTAALTTVPARDVVITGASSGVGLAGAKLLSAAGHRVTLACRTEAKAEAAAAACSAYAAAAPRSVARAGGSARGAVCDLGSMASVRDFAASLKGKRIDVLVCNAGLARGQSEALPCRTADGFEETVGVNHLGHFLLLNLLAPTLAASGPGARLVLTASPVHDPLSGGGKVGSLASLGKLDGLAAGPRFEMLDGGAYDPDKAYKDSKLCNMLTMAEAARRFKGAGVTVNAFSPGLIANPEGFFRNQNPTFAQAFNKISQLAGVAETNEFGGSALAFMAVDPSLDGVSGGWYDTLPPGAHQLAKHAASEEARDEEEQRRLWELSTNLVGPLRA